MRSRHAPQQDQVLEVCVRRLRLRHSRIVPRHRWFRRRGRGGWAGGHGGLRPRPRPSRAVPPRRRGSARRLADRAGRCAATRSHPVHPAFATPGAGRAAPRPGWSCRDGDLRCRPRGTARCEPRRRRPLDGEDPQLGGDLLHLDHLAGRAGSAAERVSRRSNGVSWSMRQRDTPGATRRGSRGRCQTGGESCGNARPGQAMGWAASDGATCSPWSHRPVPVVGR